MADTWEAPLVDLRHSGRNSNKYEEVLTGQLADFAIDIIRQYGSDIADRRSAAEQCEVMLRLGGTYEQIEALIRQLAGLPGETAEPHG